MTEQNKTILQSLGSGLVGACVLTTVHETARHFIDEAPRIDVLGEQALKKVLKKADVTLPDDERLYGWTLGGDLVSNTLYYSLIGLAKSEHSLLTGTALGLVAGLGAVGLPGALGLDTDTTSRKSTTSVMTVGWYLLGGLATAAVYRLLTRK